MFANHVVDMRRSLLWVIGFCWMLLTLASLESTSLGSEFVGPFLVTARIGEVAYRPGPQGLVHHVFTLFFMCKLASQVCSRWQWDRAP